MSQSPLPDSNRRPLPYHETPADQTVLPFPSTPPESGRAEEGAESGPIAAVGTRAVPELPRVVPGPKKSGVCRTCTECVYCGSSIVSRHEHDHMPLAARFGGTDVVAACLDCHDLKDRLKFDDWPDEVVAEALLELVNQSNSRAMRIYLAKATNLVGDFAADARKWKALALAYGARLEQEGIDPKEMAA